MAASTLHIHPLISTSTNKSPKTILFGQGLRTFVSFSHQTSSITLNKNTSKNRRNGAGALRVVVEKVVGIDLETTNSAVGGMEGRKPVIVTNRSGREQRRLWWRTRRTGFGSLSAVTSRCRLTWLQSQ